MTKAEIDEMTEEDLLRKIEEKGVLDEVMNRLNIETGDPSIDYLPQKVRNTQTKPKKIPIDPTHRYLYLKITGGKAFIEHLENDAAVQTSGRVPSFFILHIYFQGQRFKSKPTSCTVEPEFNEGFLLELGKDRYGGNQRPLGSSALIGMPDQIHMVLIKSDITGDNTIVSSHFLEWRAILTRSNCSLVKSIELLGVGAENKVTVGILDIQLEFIPHFSEGQIVDDDIFNGQISLEKNHASEKERLFLIYAKQWWKEYLQIRTLHRERLVKIFAQDENGVNRVVCSFIKPLRASRLLDTPRQAARFVALIGYEKLSCVGAGERVEQWSSIHAFLCRNKGDCEDHAILLCCLLLGFGLDAYVAVGTKMKGSAHTWVVTIDTYGKVMFWESLTGQRYQHSPISLDDLPHEKVERKQNHPYKTIGCLFNDKKFFANNQSMDRVDVCKFNLEEESSWKKMSEESIEQATSPPWPVIPPLISSTIDSATASNDLETELKIILADYRADKGLSTVWDDHLGYLLTPALASYEFERTTGVGNCGNDEFQDSVRRLVPDGHTFKAYPIQFVHNNAKRAFSACLKSPVCEEIITCNGDQVRMAVRVRVFTYPESAIAAWWIIGGGIGGASTAFWLSRLYSRRADIHIYESTDSIGGRLKTVEIDGHFFEAGGSIIHPRNSYAKQFVKLFGLKQRESNLDISFSLVQNDKEVILHTYRDKILKLMQMLYFFKLDSIRIQSLVSRMLRDFENIYDLQTESFCYSHPNGLLTAMNVEFSKYLNTTLMELLKSSGMSKNMLDFANAALRTNYGQDETHAFVGSVCMAGIQSGLWAIHNGNKGLVERFIQVSKAKVHLNTKIMTIKRNNNKFTLVADKEKFSHDIVIIAAPLEKDMLQTSGFEMEFPSLQMHQTVATFVNAELNSSFWEFGEEKPEVILAIKSFYNSIGKQTPINYNSDNEQMKNLSVYKIFSNNELTDNQLNKLFKNIRQKKVISWKAYPEYSTPQLTNSFILADNLYYNNAIESLASAIEMSIISARNSAILAYYKWKGDDKKIDPNLNTFHAEL
ncbi:DgyrCDS3437 [Dimorphilus gyrociliatus]|uniref:Centrosomal protein of 76 kDa n=1 Tax=Dimorphilus gyrociliatus TaxID=2664684 RepID=A0A7I8VDP0_9ANNE|nr:DgyrCDS3437 [Dimorphilus gyrociliatus]